ncbi:hypothetical protein MVEN_00398000 [Mycena venus]|uniref:F-box domain-containing protein n=1 Tax=Mycena venus TaxID=2733690 RepID=A0A8H7DA63_9AGAR|nr:hypothetical protein MVEN_00398000 [Mycena venus]
MGGDSSDFDARLSADLKGRVATLMSANPGISPQEAMRQAQAALLAEAEADLFHKITDLETRNNPFRPPTSGCPVNDLPPELLAHIFMLGSKMDNEEDPDGDGLHDGDDSEDDEEDEWETDDEEGDADEEVVEDGDADVRMGSPEKRRAPRRSLGDPAPPDTDDEDSDEEDEDDGEDEEEPFLPFQVLVSHVCRHWREIALGTHTLWTTIRFAGHMNAEKAAAWINRANGLPLDIFIDATDMHDPLHDEDGQEGGDGEQQQQPPGAWPADDDNNVDLGFSVTLAFNPDTGTLTTSTQPILPGGLQPPEPPTEPCLSLDDLKVILDMIIPHVAQWRVFEVTGNFYTYMYEVLSRLAQCPAAPLLEELGLYNYEESEQEEEVETFQPAHLAEAFLPFNGNAPKLTHVAFWGVHIAWEGALPMFAGLKEIELAYHTKDVRPSFATFRAMFDASPELELLSLCYSGPTGDMEAFAIPSLNALVLCDMEMDLVQPLVAALELPALEELTLDLHEEDYTEFAEALAGPARGQTRSLLAGLTTLKLAGLHCNDRACDLVMGQLDGLKRLHLKCDEGEEDPWFKLLSAMKGTGPQYCPKLESLRLEGIEGLWVRKLVEARKEAGAPFVQVSVGTQDYVTKKDENWLRANVEQFEYFEPSDDEADTAVEIEEPMDTDD